MKVFIILFCALVIYNIVDLILQCKGCTIDTSAECDSIDILSSVNGRDCNCALEDVSAADMHVASEAIEYCENVTVTTINIEEMLDRQCFNDATYKVFCLAILSALTMLMPMWKTQRKPTKIVKTKLKTKLALVTKLDHLRAVLNAISVGVVSADSQMKITFMNSAAAEMCGWSPKLALGKPFNDIVQFKNNNLEVAPFNLLQTANTLELHSREGRYLEIQKKVSPLAINGETAGVVALLLDVTASREVIRKLSHTASHDPLTGLPNRAIFEKCLRRAVITSEDSKHTLVYIDLDGFKNINDTSGHAAGDELLKQIAKLMQSQLRHSDFVARLGGDEFGIILFNCGVPQAKDLISVLVSYICEYSFRWQRDVKHVGASAGLTRVDSSKDIEKLLAEADAACYDAKRRGKRQVCVFEQCTEN